MRLIDADSFKDHIRNSYCQECIEYNGFIEARCFACRIDDIIEDLEDTNYSSTLDVRPNIHARWIESEDGYFSCSNCHNDAMIELHESSQKLTPFCPYCGAKMGEDRGKKNRDRLKTMSDEEWYQFITGKELEILKFKGISFYRTFMEWLDEEAQPITPFSYNPYRESGEN